MIQRDPKEALLSLVARRWRGIAVLTPVLIALCMDLALSMPSDVTIYHHYVHQALTSPLFHTLPKEYPPAALVLFMLPLLAPVKYAVGFAVLAIVATLALLLCSDGLPAFPGWSRRVAIYLLVGASAVLLSRYDIFPALATFLAVESARRGRWRRAWVWVVIGGLLKIFPLVLVPGFLVAERARTGRWPVGRVVAACVPFTVMAAVQSAFAPGSAFSPLLYEARRGFEFESVAGALTLLSDPLHIKWLFSYGSWEIVGSYHTVISLVVSLAMLGGLLAVWRLAYQRRLSVEACSLAVLSLAVLGDKAFSPQYLIWLVPLWAYWPLRAGWLTAAAVTTVVYPFLFLEGGLHGHDFYAAAAVAVVRNVVLIVVTTRWLREQVHARELGDPLLKAPIGAPALHEPRKEHPGLVQLPDVVRQTTPA